MKFPAFSDATRTLRDWSLKLTRWRDEYDKIEQIALTAGTLTPDAGTVTGGTSEYLYSISKNRLVSFSLDIVGWTQNTSAATTYTIPLPVPAIDARRMDFTAQDRNSSRKLIASTEVSNSHITIRKEAGGTWGATAGVNIVINGFYWTD